MLVRKLLQARTEAEKTTTNYNSYCNYIKSRSHRFALRKKRKNFNPRLLLSWSRLNGMRSELYSELKKSSRIIKKFFNIRRKKVMDRTEITEHNLLVSTLFKGDGDIFSVVKQNYYSGLEFHSRIHKLVGSRPIKPHTPDHDFINYIETFSKDFFLHALRRYRVEGSFENLHSHFFKYHMYTNSVNYISRLVNFVSVYSFDKFGLNSSVKFNFSDIRFEDYNINVKGQSGFYSSIYFSGKKGESLAIYDFAYELIERMKFSNVENYDITGVSGRDKPQDINSPDFPKGRLIQISPFLDIIISQPISQITIQILKENKKESEIYLGHAMTKNRFSRFNENFSSCLWVSADDHSSFDCYIPKFVIYKSIWMILENFIFDSDRQKKNYINYVMSGLVDNLIVVPGGYVYRKKRGIGSGHAWTSLIGSISNLLMIRSVLFILGGVKMLDECVVAVGGDDFMVGGYTQYTKKIFRPKLFRRMFKFFFGMKLKPSASFMTLNYNALNVNYCVPFWAHLFPFGLPARLDKEVIDSLYLPPRYSNDNCITKEKTALAFLYDTPFSWTVHVWLRGWHFYNWKLISGIKEDLDWRKLLIKSYNDKKFVDYYNHHRMNAIELYLSKDTNIEDIHIVPENFRIYVNTKKPPNIYNLINQKKKYRNTLSYISYKNLVMKSNNKIENINIECNFTDKPVFIYKETEQ